MTADFADWQDEHSQDHKRRLRTAVFVSLAVHAVVLGIFAVSPPAPVAPTPEYLSVDLIAAAPPTRRAAPSPAPPAPPAQPSPSAKSAPPPPEPSAPALPEPSAPAPPIAEAPVQVLPEETPGRIRKAKPDPPKVVAEAKVEPTPKPKPPAPPPRRKEKEEVFADDDAAMAALMAEMGGDDVTDLLKASAAKRADDAAEAAESAGSPQKGIEVSPEQLAWDRKVQAQISRRFPDIARYRGRRLVAQVEINVTSTGAILGEPRLVRTSGDLDFDRRAVSAILLASPLPVPPGPGPRMINLNSEDR